MKNFRRVFTLLLALVLALGLAVQCFAEETDPVAEIMEKFPSAVRAPKKASLLEEPKTCWIESWYGNLVYAYRSAASGGRWLYKMEDWTEVTVYAEQNGWSLCLDEESGRGGWVASESLSDIDRIAEGMPCSADTHTYRAQRPVRNEYFDEYKIMYVKSTRGIRIYVFDKPVRNSDERTVIGYANEADEVKVVAADNGFWFIIDENTNTMGWVAPGLLAEEYK